MIKTSAAHLIKFVLAPLWVVDGRLIAILKEVSCGNETITACVRSQCNSQLQANMQAEERKRTIVTRTAGYQDPAATAGRLDTIDWKWVSGQQRAR